MTKDQALQAWFEQFMTAYPATSVPADAVFPWLTYEYAEGAWEEGEVSLTVNLWFYTESEVVPNRKAQELSRAIGPGGVTIPCETGLIWLKRGSPWCQSLRDDADPAVKRRYINITAEYLTVD